MNPIEEKFMTDLRKIMSRNPFTLDDLQESTERLVDFLLDAIDKKNLNLSPDFDTTLDKRLREME